jgi:hypothetical protein
MKTKLIIPVLILTWITIPFTVFAMDMHHGHSGKDIHTSSQGDYTFAYQLIDMTGNIKKMKKMPGMEHMTATHHLMANVGGSAIPKNSKVGFVITDPDGKKEKVMAMKMGAGFGADVTMMKKGEYKIKVKFMFGDEKLMEEFAYQK